MRVPIPILAAIAVLLSGCGNGFNGYPDPSSRTLPADFVRKNDNTVVAKDRRSTTTQPPFWDGTGTDHNLSVAWDCTAGNDIRTLLPTPAFSERVPSADNECRRWDPDGSADEIRRIALEIRDDWRFRT